MGTLEFRAALDPVRYRARNASYTQAWADGIDLDKRLISVTAATSPIAGRKEPDRYQISYDKLVDAFFHSIDPTDAGGQFCDRGESYRTAVFAIGPDQMRAAEAARSAAAGELDQRIATEVKPAATFYPAEEYHQDYAVKNPGHYKRYRAGCGRDAQVRAVWGDSAQRGMAPELG